MKSRPVEFRNCNNPTTGRRLKCLFTLTEISVNSEWLADVRTVNAPMWGAVKISSATVKAEILRLWK